jgi:hypothetical protein
MSTNLSDNPTTEDMPTDWLEIVRKKVSHLRFGSVQITVHDGRVTQVESLEKTRIVPAPQETPHLKSSN